MPYRRLEQVLESMFNLCTVKVLRIHRNANSLLLDATLYFEFSWFRFRAAVSSNPYPDYITLVLQHERSACFLHLPFPRLRHWSGERRQLARILEVGDIGGLLRYFSLPSRRSSEADRARGCCCKSSRMRASE
jgi:hypothetical protein